MENIATKVLEERTRMRETSGIGGLWANARGCPKSRYMHYILRKCELDFNTPPRAKHGACVHPQIPCLPVAPLLLQGRHCLGRGGTARGLREDGHLLGWFFRSHRCMALGSLMVRQGLYSGR